MLEAMDLRIQSVRPANGGSVFWIRKFQVLDSSKLGITNIFSVEFTRDNMDDKATQSFTFPILDSILGLRKQLSFPRRSHRHLRGYLG